MDQGRRQVTGVSVVMAVVLLAGCAQEPATTGPGTPSPSIHPSPSASASPAAPPTPSVAPSEPPAMGPDTIARVVTGDLVVRSLPEISDRSTIDPTYLLEGQLLFVLDGPMTSDGYQWFEVAPFDRCPGCNDTPRLDVPPDLGWVAAGSRDGEPWLLPFDEPCLDPRADSSHWRPGFIALACHGSETLTIDGTFEGCSYVTPGFRSPMWLTTAFCELVPIGFDPNEGGGIGPGLLTIHVKSDQPLPSLPYEPGTLLRVIGHLDDPAARTCVEELPPGEMVTPPELVVLQCRAAFVVAEAVAVEGASPYQLRSAMSGAGPAMGAHWLGRRDLAVMRPE